MRGVMDHLVRHKDICPLGPPLSFSHWIPYAPSRGAFPIQQKQKSKHGQVGRGHVGLLLEADEDDNDQRGGNHVVALKVKQGNQGHPQVKDISGLHHHWTRKGR